MYGLHQDVHNFNVLPTVKSLPHLLRTRSLGNILSGIIGKKDVGRDENFHFDYEQTEHQHSINEIGRNITNIKLFTREFLTLAKKKERPFFLLVSFHDPHRCGQLTPQYGEFCERWGSGEQGMGSIKEWKPIYYDWHTIQVPPYLPDTYEVRQELAAQYMTISRLDQGAGLVLQELELQGFYQETLVIYTSANGSPFPGGRTNLYDFGIRVPFIMASPKLNTRHHETTAAMVSLLDVFPTVLDVFNLKDNNTSKMDSKSLLPLLFDEPKPNKLDHVFGSQNFHEISMNYPMRMIRTRRFKLIHNLNFWSYFPVDQSLYTSPTFQQILNATLSMQPIAWYRTLRSYYQRPEWELYDMETDVMEKRNLIEKVKYNTTVKTLQQLLYRWQMTTNDPWRCSPHAILLSQGVFKDAPICSTLGHDVLKMYSKHT